MDARAQGRLDRHFAEVPPVDDEALIDLRRIGLIIRRRLSVILVVSAVVLAATAAAYLLSEQRYAAQVQVALERGAEQVINVDQVSPPVTPDSASVDTEVEVLRSPQLAGEVVDALNLTADPEFNPPPENGAALNADQARRRAISILLGGLTVGRDGFSYAITVGFESESPQTAARVANAIADIYVNRQVQVKTAATSRASKFLEEQIAKLRGQVLAAETAVQQYRARNGLLAATADSSVTQAQLSGLNAQLAEARAQQAAAEARLNTARSQLSRGGTGEELGESLDSPVVSQLRAQRAEIGREVAALRKRYGEKHPDLQRAEESMRDTDSQISAEVNRIIANVTIQANVARQRTGSIAGSLGQTEGTLATNNAASVRLNELERNAESARLIYQAFLDRYRQTLAQRGLERSGSYIVARAAVPVRPVSPNPLLFLVAGLVAALGASAAAVALLQLLERGLATSDAIEKRLGVSSLGSVPDVNTLPEFRKVNVAASPIDLVVERPQSTFAEAFRRLRTSVLFASTGSAPKVVAITSALPGEGKTTTAICFARSAALAGMSVVLVDCDMRRRASSRVFSPLQSAGLAKVLEGKAPVDDALVLDSVTGLKVLPHRGEAEGGLSLADGPAFPALIASLRERFDLVVLDTPPILPVDDSRVVCAQADGVVLLVRWRKTPAKAAEHAIRQLDDVGAHLLGASLSLVDVVQQARAGFGDAGYYYHAYKSYYA